MKKEDKELLFKDLSARLPYGVMFKYKGEYGEEPEPRPLFELNKVMVNTYYELEGCKPYLRPMSSITEEEMNLLCEYTHCNLLCKDKNHICLLDGADINLNVLAIDWLSAHHFDYRGLIEKGLALEAPEGMYNFE